MLSNCHCTVTLSSRDWLSQPRSSSTIRQWHRTLFLPLIFWLSVSWMIIPGGNFISISFVIGTFGRFWQKNYFAKMTEIILAKVKKEIQEGNNQRPAIIFWKSNYSLSVLICFYELLSNVKFRTNHKSNPTRLTNKGFTSFDPIFLYKYSLHFFFCSCILNFCIVSGKR